MPVAYEMRFENGKIDRVDLCKDKDKVYVKVLDYKTGSKAFDVVAFISRAPASAYGLYGRSSKNDSKTLPGQ